MLGLTTYRPRVNVASTVYSGKIPVTLTEAGACVITSNCGGFGFSFVWVFFFDSPVINQAEFLREKPFLNVEPEIQKSIGVQAGPHLLSFSGTTTETAEG